MADSTEEMSDSGDVSFLFRDLLPNIFNFTLIVVIIIMLYKIYKSYHPTPYARPASSPELPKLRKDFTPEELRAYNGTGPDGRILVAVNGKVFDVTRGRQFYGPGAPYSAFGGRDASRGLATFSVEPAKDDYDDLSDLTSVEMDSMREWEEQFREKYLYVGKLLKRGEKATNYSDEEDETAAAAAAANAAQSPEPQPEKKKDD